MNLSRMWAYADDIDSEAYKMGLDYGKLGTIYPALKDCGCDLVNI